MTHKVNAAVAAKNNRRVVREPDRTSASYVWRDNTKPLMLCGKLYTAPTQEEVCKYYEHTGNPHPWRCWDAGTRYIAFNRRLDMRDWLPRANYVFNKIYYGRKNCDINGVYAPTCGTAGCHAGTASIIIPDYEKVNTLNVSYLEHGKCILSAYLTGDTYSAELTDWASENPELWGNDLGYSMFAKHTLAFDKPGYIVTSKQVGKHWQAVAKRIAQAENRYV